MRRRRWSQALRAERLETRDLLAAVDALRIAEIMYHPADPTGGPFAADDFEFLELINTSAETIDISGVAISSGVTFNFASSSIQSLAGGARLLVVKSTAAFETRYGAGLPVAGAYGGQLANGGETITVVDGATPVQSVTYGDSWRPMTDGAGFSLVAIDPAATPDQWSSPVNYRGSLREGGSPGTTDAPLNAGDVVINEILAHTDVDPGDWIELHNTTERAINISDWYLSDKATELNRYRIGFDEYIPAGGYATFTQKQDFGNSNDPGALVPFGFSELGESAYLSSWDSNGLSAAYMESQGFRATEQEVSLGRHITSEGETMFVEQSVSTFDAANAAPLVGPVVISEIMYNQAGAGNDREFIELHNRSGAPIQLFDPLVPANTWKFTNGVDFVFPLGVTIPAGGYLVVAGIDPAVFRAVNNVPVEVPVLGPWLGGLDKNGEALTLSHPGDPELDGFVPYYRADHVNYDDSAPWPSAADGDGPSLVRAAMDSFGNDPASWQASTQNGGTPGRPNAANPLPGDTNGDSLVDILDLNNVRNNFGAEGPGVLGDTNGDNRVDITDLNAVRNNFGAALPSPSPTAVSPVQRPQDMRPAHDAALGELLFEWTSARAKQGARSQWRLATVH